MSPDGRRAAPALDLARDWTGRRVTVMGLGLFGGGAAVARAFARRGARVTVTDLRSAELLAPSLRELAGLPLELVLGEHRASDFEGAELVVANPAVRPDHELLALARARGAAVAGEAELFLANVRARVVCVTGTQGKSSVCHVLHRLLELGGIGPGRAVLGGNIGNALVERALELDERDTVVLEISSYQLEALGPAAARGPSPVAAACVTNVLADHIERHGSLAAYARAKARVVELVRGGGALFLPARLPEAFGPVASGPARRDLDVVRMHGTADGRERPASGLWIERGAFVHDGVALARVADLALPGPFQRENACVALGIAHALGVEPAALAAALPRIRGLPHRLEDLGTFAGHRVWDNGVSTTPDSTLSALEGVAPGCTLLAGGQAKDLPLDELAAAAAARVRRVIAFGASGALLERAFAAAGVDVLVAADVPAAVALAFRVMEPGAELVFSPACASFDAYPNFAARARDFRAALPAPDRSSGTGAPAGAATLAAGGDA